MTRGPRSPLAAQAVGQLDIACELFTKAARLSRRAAKALVRLPLSPAEPYLISASKPILNKLKEKAQFALAAAKTDGSHGALWKVDPAEDADELEIFAGKTRLVESKRLSPSPSIQSVPSGGSDMQRRPDASMAAYEQDYKSIIAPPTVPPIPQVASVSAPQNSSTWYPQSRGYPSAYSQHQQPTAGPSSYAMHPGYDDPQSGYSQQQHWQSMQHLHPHPSHHAQPPSPGSHQHVPSQLPHPGMHGLPPMHIQRMTQDYPSDPVPVPSPAQYRHTAPQGILPQPQHQPQEAYLRDQRTPAYPVNPSFQGMPQGYMPPAELVALGLASRESRLDERWASFIHESGYLDGINFNGRS